jgi:hypothetical protein
MFAVGNNSGEQHFRDKSRVIEWYFMVENKCAVLRKCVHFAKMSARTAQSVR